MERKLSDKERFIIQVAVNRSAENHFDRQKGWKRVKRCTNNGYIIRRRHSWLAICVSALCLLSGSGYLFIRHFAVYPPAISPSPEIYKADGIPVLTLENGEQIFLNPNQSPLIRPQTAANLQLDSIVQSIRYLPTETPGYDSTLSYHSLEIPKGGEYRLQLADGSRIWLNSESSLRYPVKFGLHRREIFLSGEEAKGYRKQLWLDENGMMGYLEIPSIRVYLPIYHGTEEAVLQKGVGHLSWTSLPIEGKSVHSVLSGHRGLPSAKLFTDLDQLREDDAFSVHILGSVLTYQVEQICVVAPTETEALRIEPEKNYCTLMTCTPYGVNTQRLLIRGILTDTDTAQERQESGEEPQSEKLPLLPVLIAGGFVLAVCLLIRKKRKGKEEIG